VSLGELKTSLKLRFYRVLGGCQGVSLSCPLEGGWGVGPGAGSKSSGVMSGTYFSAPSWGHLTNHLSASLSLAFH
jgi:hypothetical protein